MTVELPFQDRTAAGRILGAHLATTMAFSSPPVVFGLPRGGVPVAAEVALIVHGTLDVLVVRKLGVPSQPELAMGAIAGHAVYLDTRLIQEIGISEAEVQQVALRESRELKRRERIFRRGRSAADLHGRIVILVDDGLATGSTMIVAVRHARHSEPARLIVAAPVGSREACSRIEREGCECVCAAQPEPFEAVGKWYSDFTQVTDQEVEQILLPRTVER